ncbi:MAG: hypothetical protein ACR2LJ_11340 [Acidimicrobiales bacterium]
MGGDHDTEGTTGTIGGSNGRAAGPAAAVGSGTASSGTEGTIADPSKSTTDEVGARVPDPATVTQEASTAEAVAPGAVAVEPEAVAVEFDRGASADQDAGTTSTDGGSDDAVHPPPSPLPPPDDPGSTSRSRRGLIAILTVLSLVVVGAGVGGVIWSRSGKKKATPPPAAQSATSPTLPDGSFVTFKDSEAGFTIRYPRGWARSQPPVAEIRLWASDGKQFAASVRVIHTEEVTTPANLANLKAVTDGIVGPGVQILKQDPITVNGLIGYRYIYTLTDKDSGLTAAHLHYFLFQGHKMNSIVFEAVPSETFSRIEGVFDQMLGSFRSDPEPPS